MPHRRKPFIDKKHATTYRLIPGFVPDSEEENNLFVTDEEIGKRKEDQRHYGVFFDDSYNYMQHLRSLTEGATMVKVSDFNNTDDEVRSSYGGSVDFKIFSSQIETNKEERFDPDILASLEEAPEVTFNEEGEMEIEDDDKFLEDDFITQAGGYEPKLEKEEDQRSDRLRAIEEELGSDFDDEDFTDDESDDEFNDEMDVQESRGRGNYQDDIIEAQTALILKNFEEGLGFSCVAQQIDDDDGRATTEDYENLKEILMQDKLKEDKMMTCSEFLNDHANRPAIDTSKYENGIENEEEFEWKEVPVSKPKFDCVSILSLNSNTRNLPTDIIPPSSQKKRLKETSTSDTDPSGGRGLSLRELEEEMRLSRRADKASTFRPQNENSDERKNRKQAIKEERKDRRQEKKANKTVFSMEKQKLDKEVATLSKSGRGIKLS